MALAPGIRLGAYEIAALIGSGGMGEVYRARDTRLGRDVAMKVLPSEVATDPDRLARFEREAQVLAALNHPNIAHIHGIEDSTGMPALVMELVDGPTLADRIAKGPIPLDEALPIAKQIAEALEAAHEQGIIHRDLKPANIKVRPDGTVKVLDFGLAKATDGGPAVNMTASPTLTVHGTRAGVILGTAAYMSPEQARGRPVDKRADIWAFGCVVYEMLAGTRPFPADTTSDAIAAILDRHPDWSRLPAAAPKLLRRLLKRCLEKDPKQRLRDIGDARFEFEDTADRDVTGPSRSRTAAAVPFLTGALVATAVAIGAVSMIRGPSSKSVQTERFSVDLGADVFLSTAMGDAVALSPDGMVMAFAARRSATDSSQLFVRRIDQLDATPIPDTRGAFSPFFSPDGQALAFFAEGKLKRVAIGGSASLVLCDAPNGRGGWWSRDDIVFSPDVYAPQGLMHVSPAGGHAEPFGAVHQQNMRWPQVLPGNILLFSTHPGPPNGWNQGDIVALMADGTQKTIVRNGYHARYVDTGQLLYVHDATLFAAPFDAVRLEMTGNPVPVIEGISTNANSSASAQFAVAQNGTLIYVRGRTSGVETPMQWMDRDGHVSVMRAQPSKWRNPQFSPTGERVAVDIGEGDRVDVFVYDWTRDTLSRLIFAGMAMNAVWSPDGRALAFNGKETGDQFNLYVRRADGVGSVQRITHSDKQQVPTSWHPSGKFLAYQQVNTATKNDLLVVPMESNGNTWIAGAPRVLVDTPGNDVTAVFSPDGRWVAYTSDYTGRIEIYVRPFETSGGPWQVSVTGGDYPTWSHTTHELFYEVYNGTDMQLMAAPYTVDGDSFHVGKPLPWSSTRFIPRGGQRPYDVHPDGRRAVVALPDEADAKRDRIVVVEHWSDELMRLAPEGVK